MGNYDFDLISLKPATNQKEKDRQTEADNQKRSINSAKYLFDKEGEDGGIYRNQTREGDWEQAPHRKERPDDNNDKSG
jgi:hypothetical protein